MAGALVVLSACASTTATTTAVAPKQSASAAPAVPIVVDATPDSDPKSFGCATVESAGVFGGCARYVSTGGHDSVTDEDLPWLASDPLTINFAYANDALTLLVGTPCNSLQAAVELTDKQLIADPKHVMTDLMACLDQRGQQGSWAMDFIGSPMTYDTTGNALTLTTSLGEVTFRRV